MFEFMRVHQLNLMLVLSGVCAVIAFFVLLSKNTSRKRKGYMVYLQVSSMLLMLSDRYAYIYRGDTSELGYYMVRICNFMVYFLVITIIHAFNLYLADMLKNEGGLVMVPMRLRYVELMVVVGVVLLVISQFTGFFYTFDENNNYQRAPGFFISYAFPFLALFLLFSVIISYYDCLGKRSRFSFVLLPILPVLAAVAQFFIYGLSIINITIVGVVILVYTLSLIDLNETAERVSNLEIEYLRKEHRSMRRLFEQTAKALVSAIDAKDKYTQGHSLRVAGYAREIAAYSGKTEKECDEVYYAALLHDVGKIGVADGIIAKNSGLTDEEYEEARQHVQIGTDILAPITEFPYLSLGARYHHERYDGKGYPDGLKGNDIPEIARIIAVADVYDVMTSKRQYKDIAPQETVREEIIKGTGTQFDPEYAKIMLHLMDLDSEYEMKEKAENRNLPRNKEIHPIEFGSEVSEGIMINDSHTKVHFRCKADENATEEMRLPTIIVFDSVDGRYYDDERKVKEFSYFEFGQINLDGTSIVKEARKIQTKGKNYDIEGLNQAIRSRKEVDFVIEAVRYKDHIQFALVSEYQTINIIMALQDSGRYSYMAVTGEHCYITGVDISKSVETIDETYIPRIAEEVSYIDGPVGDIPNMQIEGYQEKASDGIEVTGNMSISFHTKSLPAAHLLWHCPHVVLFSSDDDRVGGPNYEEYSLLRFDGEHWEATRFAENRIIVNMNEPFVDWDGWKAFNKEGYDSEVFIKRKGNEITITTQNYGISVRSVTTIKDTDKKVAVAITGDQVAITNIRIKSA